RSSLMSVRVWDAPFRQGVPESLPADAGREAQAAVDSRLRCGLRHLDGYFPSSAAAFSVFGRELDHVDAAGPVSAALGSQQSRRGPFACAIGACVAVSVGV